MMKRPVVFWLACATLLVAGCAPQGVHPVKDDKDYASIAKMRSLLIGDWVEEYISDEGLPWKQRTRFFPDGRFQYIFRHYHADGGYDQDEEDGVWGVAGDVFFSIHTDWVDYDGTPREEDPSDPKDYGAFHILTLTQDKFVYKSVQEGITFTARRVPQDYRLPDKP